MRKFYIILLVGLILSACKKDKIDPAQGPGDNEPLTQSIFPYEFSVPLFTPHLVELDFDQDTINDLKIYGTELTSTGSVFVSFEGLNGWTISSETYHDTVFNYYYDSTVHYNHSKAHPYQVGELISVADSFNIYPSMITYYYGDIYGSPHLNPDTSVVGDTVYFGIHKSGFTGWIKVFVSGLNSLTILDVNYQSGDSILAGE